MAYEIDYIPVGTGEKGGDAICMRFGNFNNPEQQYVVVIDGGTKKSGEAIIEHIEKYYGTKYVDLVVATHLHSDHISGLTEVIEALTVEKLVVHCPWDYTSAIKKMTNTSSSLDRLETKLEKSLSMLSTLIDLTEKNKVQIIQPFAGDELLNGVNVLGPTSEYYKELLVNFGVTPEAKKQHKIDQLFTKAKEVVNWIAETLDFETLSDNYPDTTPENNSSLVLLFEIDGKRFLFTGDAGKDALTRVIEYSESNDISLNNLDFFDIPHHGSKRNLGPTILNYIKPKQAFISCPPQGDPKHPSRKVVNALIRRDCAPCTNKHSATICCPSDDAPQRKDWIPITPESFYTQVEE